MNLHEIIAKLANDARFASLRVSVQRGHSHQDCIGGVCRLTCLSYLEIRDCDGRGWVPEPNRRVALWEILKALPKETQLVMIQRGLDEHACLTEAQHWLESML